MHKKRFAFLSVVLAMLCAFALVFAACDNGESSGETPSTGDPFEGYVEVPAEDEGELSYSVEVDQSAVSVAYGGTVEITATVLRPVAGTLTWTVSAEGEDYIAIIDGGTAAITAENYTSTVTLSGEAYTGDDAYAVTATFAPADGSGNNATDSCDVSVTTRTLSMTVSGTASTLYNGTAAPHAATLTAVVNGAGTDESFDVSWTITDNDDTNDLATLNTTTGNSVTVTANENNYTGNVTVSAVANYNDGSGTAQMQADYSIVIRTADPNVLASIDFDADTADSTTATVISPSYNNAITGEYTLGGVQRSVARNGNALAVVKNTGAAGSCTAPGIEVTVPDTVEFVDTDDAVSFSFWFNTSQGEDWNVIARVGDNNRITFGNLCTGSGNLWPTGGDTAIGFGGGALQNGAQWDVISEAADVRNTWTYITVVISETDGIQFYKNGTLVIAYPASNTYIAGLATSFLDVFRNGGTIVFFSNNENAGSGVDYIDDLQITKNISAAELYAAATATE